MPFLSANMSAKIGYEGYIDLLAVHAGTGAWQVVDWKTDRLPGPDPAAALREAYAPQVAVYAAALGASTGREGRCLLYSTVSGEGVDVPLAR
ncbi:MAG: PD-(D/E)XK nuclease family protein [Opitutales bacterium]